MATAIGPYSQINNYVFTPNQVSGLALWLDAADDATVIRSGNNVTQWNDKSGNNRNFATTSGTPTYSPPNGINFSGPRLDIMSTSVTVPYTAGTTSLYVVVQVTGVNAGFSYIFVFGNNTADAVLRYSGGGTFNGNDVFFNRTWFLNGSTGGTTIPVSVFNNTTLMNGTINFSGTTVLQISSSFIGRYFSGFIQEVLLFNTTLGTEQRQQVESYLAWKWAIQRSLPSTHPYAITPYVAVNQIVNIPQQLINRTTVFPNQLPGLALWLDAADTSRMTVSGSNISQYIDKSSNQIILSNTTVANQPNLVADANNMPNIQFNGTSQFLVNSAVAASNLTLNNELSIFFVHSPSNATNSLICWTNFSNQLSRINFHTPEATTGFKFDYAAAGTSSGGGRVEATIPNYLTSGRRLEGGFKRGTSQVLRIFGSNAASRTNSLTITGSTTLPLTLGWFFNLANYYYAGRFCELVWYNRALNDSEINQIEGYLAYKWNIKSGLPTSHPAFTPNFVPSIPTVITPYIWQPNLYSGLALWIDALDASTVGLSGNNIISLRDKSSNAFLFSNATGFTYNVTKFNTTYPSFFNDTASSTRDLGSNTTLNLSQPLTTFMVGAKTTTTNGSYIFDGIIDANRIAYYSGSGALFAGSQINAASNILVTNFVVCAIYNTTNSFGFLNGTQYASGNVGTRTLATGLRLGNRFTIPESWDGHICEIVFFNRVLSVRERQQMEGYLAWKWGLQRNLPSSHPFFNFPPG